MTADAAGGLALSSNACRVLGALLEKELTVPATYPMTMNALVTACNQTSGRDPVMTMSEREVDTALAALRSFGLVRTIHASHGARTTKYRQVAADELALGAAERALVTVLLLRGPQTPGELRARTERLHRFSGVGEVEEVLRHLAGSNRPLAVDLGRAAGQKEPRWAHLLGADTPALGDSAGSVRTAAAVPPSVGSGTEPVELPPVELPPELAALAGFVGVWAGEGSGQYPTIEPFGYREEIEVRPVPGKPLLTYRSSTRHAGDGRPLHAESGFLRAVGAGGVELVVAHGFGVVEVSEGVAGDGELLLESTGLIGSSTAKEVVATVRRYRVEGDTLTYGIEMAAVGVAMIPHLEARLTRR